MCPLVVTVRMIQIWLSEDNLILPSYPLEWSEVKWLSRVQLCDPMDCILPGSSVHGIFQARVLEWVAISFSRGSSRPSDGTQVSHIASRHFTVFATREAQMLEWVAYPFSSSSSQPRNQTRVSCIAGRFFLFSSFKPTELSGKPFQNFL